MAIGDGGAAAQGAAGGRTDPAGALRRPDHPQYALADRERNGPPLHGDAAVPGGCPGQARELFPGRGRAYGEPAAHAPGPAGLCREALSGGPVHPGGLRDPGRDPGLGAGPPWVPVLPEPCGGGRPGGAAACGPEAPGPGPALREPLYHPGPAHPSGAPGPAAWAETPAEAAALSGWGAAPSGPAGPGRRGRGPALALLAALEAPTPEALVLEGKAYLKKKDYALAFAALSRAEQQGIACYDLLELCCRERKDFEKAYAYACLARENPAGKEI